jgi:cysteinyl-tRNA synthetase
MKLLPTLALLSVPLLPNQVVAESFPASFAYILQADEFAESKPVAIERLAGCGRDWIVVDARFDATTPWERVDLAMIRDGQPGRKILAYISIGEAEDYRPYWRAEWGRKEAPSAPAWLGDENPDWKGNYRVKYWHADWQRLILAAIDEAMGRGFDGVYLDIVDGFEAFEFDGKDYVENRINPETKQSYRRDMVDWVKTIANRTRRNNPSALVIPQNGSQLLSHADFLEAISAIGIEDIFTDGDKPQPRSHAGEVLGNLQAMTAAQKPVLLIEYPETAQRQAMSKKLAQENGLIWLITDRPLTTLATSGK